MYSFGLWVFSLCFCNLAIFVCFEWQMKKPVLKKNTTKKKSLAAKASHKINKQTENKLWKPHQTNIATKYCSNELQSLEKTEIKRITNKSKKQMKAIKRINEKLTNMSSAGCVPPMNWKQTNGINAKSVHAKSHIGKKAKKKWNSN